MAEFSWDASYSLKMDTMDRQHQRILTLLGKIHEALVDKKAGIMLEEWLVKLETFTKVHFFDEERLMENRDFPSTNEHKRLHDQFVEEIRKLRSGSDDSKNTRTLQAISEWFINHILTEDMRYSEFFLNRQ